MDIDVCIYPPPPQDSMDFYMCICTFTYRCIYTDVSYVYISVCVYVYILRLG